MQINNNNCFIHIAATVVQTTTHLISQRLYTIKKGISSDLHVSHDGYTHESLFCHYGQRMDFKLFYFIYKEILKWTQGQYA